jgi:hypothetical protein
MRRILSAFLGFLVGCASKDSAPTCTFMPGDLVITEIMANPSGSDTGKEWFEIYNNTRTAADLTGLTLVHSKSDGTGVKTHVMTQTMLGPGGFLALGGVAQNLKPGYIGYGFGSDLGALRNDNGLVAVKCGTTIVDQVTYLTTADGASWELDGATVPDAHANDDSTLWCAAKPLYDGVNAGTPGAANEVCGGSSATSCLDGGATRALAPPGPGDLVIDEIMADPNAVGDDAGEWFEVAVLADVDLNGLQLGKMDGAYTDTVSAPDCLHYPAGSFAVFAHTDTDNGGLPTLAGTFGFTLANSGGTVAIGYGGTLLDQASYAAASAGVAWQLDPTTIDPAANDAATSFCKATASYGLGDKGTPGMANTTCGSTTMNDMCLDGSVMRAIRKPAPGDLVITEVMANPASTEPSGEWFEILANATFDLNGLQLGTDGSSVKQTVTATDCIPATPGAYLVFGHTSNNGGLAKVDATLTMGLTNSASGIAISSAGTLLDAVTWSTTTNGVSRSLSPAKLNRTDNDVDANWCAGTGMYGAGGMGTPGKANPACP